MIPVSGVNTSAARPLAAAERVHGAPRVQKPEEDRSGSLKPVTDEYVPEEKQEPFGRYWMGKDEQGQPKIYFDDPEQPADAPDGKKPDKAPDVDGPRQADGPKKPEKAGKGEERCVGDTGKVDREIERLKNKQRELEQRLGTETDENKIKDLERQLAQVKRELSQKDNDTYRRRHMTVTPLS